MSIATLPPSNHVNAIRAFIERIRRTKTLPNAQEIAHAQESLGELEKTINQQKETGT